MVLFMLPLKNPSIRCLIRWQTIRILQNMCSVLPFWLLVGTSFSLWTWDRVQTVHSLLQWMSLDIFDILLYYYTCLCTSFFGLSTLVACWSLVTCTIRRIIYTFLNVCPFDYMALVISGEVGYPETGLTTPVGWLVLLQLTVLSRFAIICNRSFLWRLCVFHWFSNFQLV